MLKTSKAQALKENATAQMDLAVKLAQDRKFRKQLLSAIGHGAMARRRAARRVGLAAAVGRLSADPKLRRELQQMTTSLQKALGRVEKKRSNKLRNALILVGVGGVAAALVVPRSRRRLTGLVSKGGTTPRTIDESIEVGVPVSTAYNQWTQFEDFPLFMEGVDDVRQIADTRLHWAATVAGRRHEWDAKILEQHPDRQISWISEDGKKTRGTVSFEPRGDSRALIRLSMSYQAEGMAEAVGSAAGLDARRVRGDLERFKELVESRGAETGAWRGEVSAGRTAD
ncbi:MAG TPA: SRPBCC family protein [Gaiellaceae bacterium]